MESKLGTMPVGKLLVNVSLPIVASMLVQAMYNVVDSIFVARLSEQAITAVSLVFPAQNLIIGVAVGTSIGVNSLVARYLGAGDCGKANRTAANGLVLAVASWVVFAAAGLLLTDAFLANYAREPGIGPEIAGMAGAYMRIVMVGSAGVFVEIMYERLLQATGRSFFSMISQTVGAVINIVLDPIMIFGLLGFPKMGVRGAALATVIGQLCAMALAFVFNRVWNKELRLSRQDYRPDRRTIVDIYKIGAPGIVMQSVGSVMVYGLNRILGVFGATAVSVFGIYFKLQSFVFMPVFGFNSGMIPIIAFNFGAKRPDRIEKTIKCAAMINICIMLLGTILFWAIPGPLLYLFNAGDEMMAIGTIALRVISVSYVFAAIGITFVGAFQALGKGVYALIISIVRQLVFLLPIAWGFANFIGLSAVWHAFYIAEFAALALGLLFFARTRKTVITPLYAEVNASKEEEA